MLEQTFTAWRNLFIMTQQGKCRFADSPKFLLVAVKMRVYQGTKGTTDQNWLIFKVISTLSPIIMEEKTWQFLKGNYYWMDLFFTEP